MECYKSFDSPIVSLFVETQRSIRAVFRHK